MPKSHWTRETIKLLGKISDRELAKRLGISFQTVAKMRQRLKIKPINSDRVYRGATRPASWGQTELGLLCYPDEHVARLTGQTIAEIRAKRAEHQT